MRTSRIIGEMGFVPVYLFKTYAGFGRLRGFPLAVKCFKTAPKFKPSG